MLPHSQPFQVTSPTPLKAPPLNIFTALTQLPVYGAKRDSDDSTKRDQNITQGNKASKDDQKCQTGRVLILCFDGMGNQFGQDNSNLVRFVRSVDKSYPGKQIVYYQPGVDTYNKYGFLTHTITALASVFDKTFATGFDDHVKKGYQFVVQNYQLGDKICLFGFSRGAHTARAVAGMIYKIGILPKESIQQVDLAFNMYTTPSYQGFKVSHEFKATFTPITNPPLSVDFVGVWHTVSSVGMMPRVHPYTSVNYAVKKFRHALALDERRARFRPDVWSDVTSEREQELDVDIPIPPSGDSIPQPKRKEKRDEWEYTPPDRDCADVKEVWFAGTHADVGGRSHSTSYTNSLSFIPLRWMIKECILDETGILFDLKYLRDTLKFDFDDLREEAKNKGIKLGDHYKDLEKYAVESVNLNMKSEKVQSREHVKGHETKRGWLKRHAHDTGARIYGQLVMFWWFRWILELIPILYTYQNHQGNWTRLPGCNFGRGRYIPVVKGKVLVHKTVQESKGLELKGNLPYKLYMVVVAGYLAWIMNLVVGDEKKYRHNWEYLQEHGKLEYVH